jgi:hypothetical protein
MNLGTQPTVPAGDTLLNTATAPDRPAGASYSRDGRKFRLVKNGAVALAQGVLVQGVAANNGHLGMIPTADVPVGARVIRVTAGAGAGTNAPANTYAGGLAIISTGPGQGQAFSIQSHDAIVALGAFNVQLASDDLVVVALTAAASRVDLIANPYTGVVITPGALTAGAVGVTAGPIDANNWGYVQVEGLCACLSDGAVAIGQAVSPSVTVNGAVVINSTTLPVIGQAVQAGVAGRAFAVNLALP